MCGAPQARTEAKELHPASMSVYAVAAARSATTSSYHPPLPLLRRYYEPLAAVATLEEVLRGPALRKLLFMTRPEVVDGHLKPHWAAALEGTEAETMQAVPNMLEVGACWVGAG